MVFGIQSARRQMRVSAVETAGFGKCLFLIVNNNAYKHRL
uniref:Uncharacterized protein n=1 Tax=Anguilla anguilla TaxID=7936 RepID=A0A0E9V8K0_ANGAN